MIEQEVKFRLVNEKERPVVIDFVESWAMKWHDCLPPPTQGEIIAAWFNGKVVGTLGADFGDRDTPFYLESIYDFEEVKTLLPKFDRTKIVQPIRWYAKIPGISGKLWQSLAEYVGPLGIKLMLCEGKDHSIKRLEELGLRFSVIYGLRPILERVPSENKKYYEEKPVPKVIILDVDYILKTFKGPLLSP